MSDPRFPLLGHGVGLRNEHYDEVLGGRPPVDWFEVVTENFMETGGRPLFVLETVRSDFPVALHGVGLSIGSTDPLSDRYLKSLKALVDRIEPALVTDHLCWNGIGGRSLYDLLPVPYTEESLVYVADRVARVQDFLGRPILLENASTYIEYQCSEIPEHEYLAALSEKADSGILLDINNVYVTCTNHGHDPEAYIDGIPRGRVGQFHLAGFTDMGTYLFDTHSAPVCEDVWDLYRRAVARFGGVSTLVEWDAELPTFDRLCAESDLARRHADETLAAASSDSQGATER